MSLTLIADSGIQFHTFKLVINPNDRVISSVGFWEHWDDASGKVTLDFAEFLIDHEAWVSTRELGTQGYVNEDGSISEEVNLNLLTVLDEETDCFRINDIIRPLEYFENKWIPLPYFTGRNDEGMSFGPLNWARLKLVPVNITSRSREYEAVLAFDTKTAREPGDTDSPVVNDNKDFTVFSLCGDPALLLNYCSAEWGCGWVDDYIADISIGGKDNIPDEFPSLKYIAYYIYFIRYLQGLEGGLPELELYSRKPDRIVDVDLVLDVGNSRTCGVLFESNPNRSSFEFNEVAKLAIRDLTSPHKVHTDPFSMRLAFHMETFGDIGYQNSTFRWPSFVRVGQEAKRLIYNAKTSVAADTSEQVTHHSSPKRYLWDDNPSRVQWELIRLNEEDFTQGIYIEGISEQFDSDGAFTNPEGFGITNNYSRKALMTFVFLEILTQANIQINSFEFRSKHGESTLARRLRRIVITCPTAMVREEQVTLRKCAQEASVALKRFYEGTYNDVYDAKEDRRRVEVIPSVKDLNKKLDVLSDRKDWTYDEATCAQLVFLYAEVSKRYLNNCKKYFDLYGKVRGDLYDYHEKSITIGSIDIGGGTTDLMISAYKYADEGTAVITPVPLYWESFNHAGDDLLKQIVQQVVLEGSIEEESERGCKGVIANAARERGVLDVERRLNDFFGTDNARMDFVARQMRKRFNVQISIPIAERYLEHARLAKKDEYVTFDDLFPVHRPAEKLLDYFAEHFGFRFEEVRWKLSGQRVNEIVQTVFEPMIRQISTLLFAKGCDFVLMAGRPTSLTKLSDMFLKYYPVSPNRIISLNEYRVGRWYPFHDGNGYFQDHKSIVAVGACVALMGGKLDRLSSFRLNMEEVKTKLISTAEYIGVYDRNTEKIKNVFLTPEINRATLTVPGLPITIGFKQLDAETYPGRKIYLLDFDEDRIKEKQRSRFPDIPEDELQQEVENYKTRLKNQMPFTVRLEREYREDREDVKIESIEDRERNDLGKSTFRFRLQTLEEEKGYWLDTGEFHLKINAR